MTGTEIRVMAQYHTENETIDNTFALRMINECILMDLGKDAWVIKSDEIEATEDTWHDLPNDFLELLEITEEGEDEPYHGKMYDTEYRGYYDIRNGQIRFPEDGTYTIWYIAMPPLMTAISDEVPVHKLLHYPISLYVASRYKSRSDEENTDAERLWNEYQAYKEKAINELVKIRPTTRACRRVRAGWWF